MQKTLPMEAPPGLAGMVVGNTAISDVDGVNGTLSYRGRDIGHWLDRPFAETAMHLVFGNGDPETQKLLDAGVPLTSDERNWVLAWPRDLHPMHVLQAAVPLLSTDPRLAHLGEAGAGLSIAAKLPEVTATHLRGAPVTAARPGVMRRFLDMIGGAHTDAAADLFERTQILQMEHSFNASTFTARVVASTRAPIANAVSAGVGALHGALHGGADQAALEMADAAGSPDRAPQFVDDCLANGDKIMGMGHREYRVVDPRARFIRDYAERLVAGTEHERTLLTLIAIEKRTNERMQEKGLDVHANVEFFKGIVLRAIGLPTPFFTACFAMARSYGYVAHVLESRSTDKLYRPAARYVP